MSVGPRPRKPTSTGSDGAADQEEEVQTPAELPLLAPVQPDGAQGSSASGIDVRLNFDGLPMIRAIPPDTVGDIGRKHYIQMTNATFFTIYDKRGNQLVGPTALESLWTAGGPCQGVGSDPIVLYDHLADRWLMSEFVGRELCIYISATSDPVRGGWFLYDFSIPNFPDYPKYAIWPDAYYVSSNEISGVGPNIPAAYALPRRAMLIGRPGRMQRFTNVPPLAAFGFQALIPSDLDGRRRPPRGSPNFFMRHVDDEGHNPGANDPVRDFLEIWEFRVDFNDPANSSLTGPTHVPVSEFSSDLCGFGARSCFPQPGTTVLLSLVAEVIMWRLQYRNFLAHETLVGNFVVDVDGTDHGGIRWFELRRRGGSWTLFQEGTYAPDRDHRWMGSVAMDGRGNIALGYSVSSQTTFPSIRVAGRRVRDPLGTLPLGEVRIFDGAFSQMAPNWGDYSSMNLDPVDDRTFWYTNEYVAPGGGWATRIASFRLGRLSTVAKLD
jgi:hypothetical protein